MTTKMVVRCDMCQIEMERRTATDRGWWAVTADRKGQGRTEYDFCPACLVPNGDKGRDICDLLRRVVKK